MPGKEKKLDRYFKIQVKAEVAMVEDGVEHPWPSIKMKFPEQTQEELVEIEEQFNDGFVQPMFAKGLGKLKKKKTPAAPKKKKKSPAAPKKKAAKK